MTIRISDAVLRKHSARMKTFLEEDASASSDSGITAEEQRALDEGLTRFLLYEGPRLNQAMVGRFRGDPVSEKEHNAQSAEVSLGTDHARGGSK